MSLTAIAFLLAFSGGLLAALFRHPIYGLYTYIAVFYLHPPDRWWGYDLPDLRWSLVAATVTLLATIRLPARPERSGWTHSGAAKILLILTGWIWIQNLWALSPEDHLELSILFTKYLILFYVIFQLLDSEETFRNFLLAHVAGCFYLGWLVFQAPEGGRLEGVGGPGIDEANALGMQLATGLLAAGALLVRGSISSRLFALASGPLILNGIIQTGSRGAFLALVCGGLAMLYLSPATYRKYWYAFGVIGLVALLKLAPDNYWERIDTILDATREQSEIDQSSETRLALIAAQWDMFVRYPAGTGHRGTAALSTQYLSEEHLTKSRNNPDSIGARSSHNTFMTALSEQGVPGVVLYLALLLWIFRTCRRIRMETTRSNAESIGLFMTAAGASLVTVTAAGMFTDYFKVEVFLWFMIFLAALAEYVREKPGEFSPALENPPSRTILRTSTLGHHRR